MVEANASMASTASSNGSQTPRSTNLENYNLGNVLGQGAYGKVILSTEKATGRVVAIKEVNKEQILKLGKQRHIFREKDLLFEMDHPFIIKLLGTTQDSQNLYFVFENCAKGDLTGLIQERSKYFLPRMAKQHVFYGFVDNNYFSFNLRERLWRLIFADFTTIGKLEIPLVRLFTA